jgi:hypothetical protein
MRVSPVRFWPGPPPPPQLRPLRRSRCPRSAPRVVAHVAQRATGSSDTSTSRAVTVVAVAPSASRRCASGGEHSPTSSRCCFRSLRGSPELLCSPPSSSASRSGRTCPNFPGGGSTAVRATHTDKSAPPWSDLGGACLRISLHRAPAYAARPLTEAPCPFRGGQRAARRGTRFRAVAAVLVEYTDAVFPTAGGALRCPHGYFARGSDRSRRDPSGSRARLGRRIEA